VPPGEPARRALREAIATSSTDLRCKSWALLRTGSGDYARHDWADALTAAQAMPDDRVVDELADEVDLHDRLMKGLYELGVAQASPAGGR
jgi:hypothetical protein